jgi:hypothetical protein
VEDVDLLRNILYPAWGCATPACKAKKNIAWPTAKAATNCLSALIFAHKESKLEHTLGAPRACPFGRGGRAACACPQYNEGQHA